MNSAMKRALAVSMLVFATSAITTPAFAQSKEVTAPAAATEAAKTADVTISVKRADGKPAAAIVLNLLQRDGNKPKSLGAQKSDVDGNIVLKGLETGTQNSMYALTQNDDMVTQFDLSGKNAVTKITVTLPPSVGDMAPDFSVKDLQSGKTITLSSLKGQVVMLDFWATWCGPCQEPMAHNNEIVGKRKDWAGKAVIVGVSIDKTEQLIRDHVKKLNLNNVQQTWIDEPGKGWGSTVLEKYSIHSIPCVALLDKTGKIVYYGHPNNLKIESEIDRLIAQK